ncbi:MAG TPA: rRNA pseudouridine synthase [Candidatus Marinimicrobia bacterium]|nr:rRNA pseudouridine synthase [Candidatus Neomarinimicrobiota bacterium]HIL86662.1 rRNA pseudouridine synthase [Candidatus Neomarinimicrobiota bacterium]
MESLMKLFKFISSSGIISRRKAQESIQLAMVTVNNVVIMDPFADIDSLKDVIRLDDQKIILNSNNTTVVLYKPKGFISSRSDEMGRKTIFDLIPRKPFLNHVGRLDKDTTGLILLTNDGDLSQFLTHPKNKIPKEYVAQTNEFINDKIIKKIEKGIFIGSGEKGKAKIISQEKIKNIVHVNMILRQGKKNEIRRIFKFSGLKLIALKRIKFGNITLNQLKEGQWRELTKKEKQYLDKITRKG